jgi:hypothetical protein
MTTGQWILAGAAVALVAVFAATFLPSLLRYRKISRM